MVQSDRALMRSIKTSPDRASFTAQIDSAKRSLGHTRTHVLGDRQLRRGIEEAAMEKDRNALIFEERIAGASYASLGRRYGLSPARVRIVCLRETRLRKGVHAQT
jgi:Mor family transcriptional regulator